MSWANVNWDEVKAKYEEGTYTYQRLAEEYGVSIQTVCSHAVKGQWQRGREEAEKQVRTWLDETAESMKAAERRDTEFRKEE